MVVIVGVVGVVIYYQGVVVSIVCCNIDGVGYVIYQSKFCIIIFNQIKIDQCWFNVVVNIFIVVRVVNYQVFFVDLIYCQCCYNMVIQLGLFYIQFYLFICFWGQWFCICVFKVCWIDWVKVL